MAELDKRSAEDQEKLLEKLGLQEGEIAKVKSESEAALRAWKAKQQETTTRESGQIMEDQDKEVDDVAAGLALMSVLTPS